MNYIALLLAASMHTMTAAAQNMPADTTVAQTSHGDVLFIDPIFEYPVAPDEIPDLNGKTNYLMEHFWDKMDFKSRETVDQTALNHAFATYMSSAPYADEDKVIASVEKLTKKIKGNEMLTIQFAKAAEETIYGPRAEMWIDRLYIPFLEVYLKDKKIPDSRKIRYKEQLRILKSTATGEKAPDMKIELRDGSLTNFSPSREFTLIEFGDPDCGDCRYARMKIDMSSVISDLLASGRLEVMFIIADEDEDGGLMKMTAEYPRKWTVGKSGDAIENYDLRATPAFYVLGPGGKIIAKNVSVDTAIEILREASSTNIESGKQKNKP